MDDDSGVGLTAEDLSTTTPAAERAGRRTRPLGAGGRSSSMGIGGGGPGSASLLMSGSARVLVDGAVLGGGDPWATPMRTPGSRRISGRFVQNDVLSALKNAPDLPSPAIRGNNTMDWSVHGTSMRDINEGGMTPQHSGYWGAQQSPDGRIEKLNQSTTWLPTPKASAQYAGGVGGSAESPNKKGGQGMWESSVDASMVSRQVLETQQPEFISLLERSIVLPPRYPAAAAAAPAAAAPAAAAPAGEAGVGVEEEAAAALQGKGGDGDLEADLRRAEAETRHLAGGDVMKEDLEVEAVWEDLMLWCSSHGNTVDYDLNSELGRGLDIWRIEGFLPVLLPHGSMGALNEGDAYLILNRVDDRSGAIGHVNDAYHDRKTRVKTLWTMHFWIGAEAHPLKAGVAAVLAVELCKVLKRHARPIREVQGEESEIFRGLFRGGKPSYAKGGCPHGFRTPPERAHRNRLIRVEIPPGRRQVACREVEIAPASLHEEACFVLDMRDVVHVYAGGKCSKKEVAFAVQTASLIAMRERNHGKSARIEMVDQDGEEGGEGGAFWAAVSGTRGGAAATRVGGGEGVAGWEEPVLYRLDDLHEQLEVTQVASGTLLDGVWPLDGSCCYILRACDRVYLWKGGRATLDARTYGQDFSSKLADESGVDVTVLAECVEDILFAAHFKEVNWVVYAEPPTCRVARGVERRLETNVKKMHSVTVRSWLHTGDAVRKHNPVLSELQQGELIGIRAWSIHSFNLIPVTQDEVGQFASDKSYLVQCTYRAEGLDRHMIYFWQGWACSKVESLVWQYDVQALMTTRLEKLTGCKPIQVTIRQGKEPGHFLQLFNGSAVFHATSDRLAQGAHQQGAHHEGAHHEGGMYALSGTCPDKAYAIEVHLAADSLQSNSSFFVRRRDGAGGFLWHGYWTDVVARDVAAHAAAQIAGSADLVEAVDDQSEPDAFWDAVGGREAGSQVAGYEREAPWWTPRLFGCKAVSCELRVREVFDFVQSDLRHHKAMLLDDYSRVYLWLGPQSNAVVQRLALELARQYIANAPDGRERNGEVTIVRFGKEPRGMKALFPWWIDWPKTAGDPCGRPWSEEQEAWARAHPPSNNMAIPWLSPAVLRQGRKQLRSGVETRERNPLDVIVWRSHERAKWLSWSKLGTSPFRNTFFKQRAGGRI